MSKATKLISILFPLGVLLSFSLTILGSISENYLQQQALSIMVAAVFFLIFFFIDYHIYTHFPWLFYSVSNVLLAVTFVFGSFSRGSIRWIDLGFIRFQTSEVVKPLLIIFFAILMSQAGRSPKKYGLIVATALVPLALIFLQPDLGSTLIVAAVIGGQLLASKIPKKYLLLTLIPMIVISPLIWGGLKPYQKDRVYSFINPVNDPLGSGYNAIQAVISVGSGKLFGRGLGQGTQSQLKFLPERQTDFIFSAISEEFGFLGSATIIAAYIALLYMIVHFAITAKDEFSRLICVGTFFVFSIQAFVNIGMNMGILPITGITLPFVSLGGSSLISKAVLLGIVANIQQSFEVPKPDLELK